MKIKIQKICNVTIEYSFIHIPDSPREDECKGKHFAERNTVCKHHIYEDTNDNKGKKHEELLCEAMPRKKPESAPIISRMYQRKERFQLDDLKIGQVFNDEEFRPSIEQEDAWNYKEDKVSAHRLQVLGNFSVAALRSVAYCQHLSHFFPSALKTVISVSLPPGWSSI